MSVLAIVLIIVGVTVLFALFLGYLGTRARDRKQAFIQLRQEVGVIAVMAVFAGVRAGICRMALPNLIRSVRAALREVEVGALDAHRTRPAREQRATEHGVDGHAFQRSRHRAPAHVAGFDVARQKMEWLRKFAVTAMGVS